MRCGRGGGGGGAGEIRFDEIVEDAFVGSVLFVDLQNAGVLGVAGRENFRRLTFEEDGGVGVAAVDHTTDDDHGRKETRRGVLASGGVGKTESGEWGPQEIRTS